jgi:hypothetical protein
MKFAKDYPKVGLDNGQMNKLFHMLFKDKNGLVTWNKFIESKLDFFHKILQVGYDDFDSLEIKVRKN